MGDAQLASVLRGIRKLVGDRGAAEQTDGQLLERFISGGEEAAFTALVQRHGPLVLGVCRRVLANEADAEDAFQATFLVLARKAGSIWKRESVGSWLHGVAYRVARKARVECARRRAHERQVATMARGDAPSALLWWDLRPVLDEELDRLGEKYRAPLVLCYLEGKTHEEAAQQLGWTNGTVCGRLARARELLRKRLTRRGVTLSTGLLAAVVSQNAAPAVPAPLAASAVKAALLVLGGKAAVAVVSAHAAGLAEGATRALVIGKLRTAAALLLALGLVGSGTGLLVHRMLVVLPPAADTGPPDAHRASLPGTDVPPGMYRFPSGHVVFSLAFSPDGKVLASGGSDPVIRLRQAGTGRPVRSFRTHQGAVSTVLFTPGGKVLVSAGYDGTIRSWDVATGKQLRRVQGHDDVVSSLALSADGTVLASAGWDRVIRLWDTATGKELGSLVGHRDRVWSVAFSPDGRSLASGSGDKTIRLWDVAAGAELRRLGEHHGGIFGVAFSPDGGVLAASENNGVCLWDVATGTELTRLRGQPTNVAAFTFSPDGRTLACGDGDCRIHLWEVATGEERLGIKGHEQAVCALAIAPDGRTVACARVDGTALVCDLGHRVRENQRAPARAELTALWADLSGEDAARAYRAVWAMAAVPGQTVPFLEDRLQGRPGGQQRIARLLADLDDQRFAVREKATEELRSLGASAELALRQTLAGEPSLEVRRRVERLLQQLAQAHGRGPAGLQTRRALEVLELMGTAESRKLLETLAETAPQKPLAREAKAAVKRLAGRRGATP